MYCNTDDLVSTSKESRTNQPCTAGSLSEAQNRRYKVALLCRVLCVVQYSTEEPPGGLLVGGYILGEHTFMFVRAAPARTVVQ